MGYFAQNLLKQKNLSVPMKEDTLDLTMRSLGEKTSFTFMKIRARYMGE